MIISVIVDDKIIIKDGVGEIINDDSFWSDYSKVHAIQINTDGESITENRDNTQTKTTKSIIDAITKKYNDTKTARELAEKTAFANRTYAQKRSAEYPSLADQLDDIYHNGIDGWKTTIKAIKDKYPK